MKIGLQTIVFGPQIDDLDTVLARIAALGVTGVEFAQRPDRLRLRAASGVNRAVTADELTALLDDHGLTLLGLAGGTLIERLRFCASGQTPLTPLYLYCDDLTDADEALVERTQAAGMRLALHPHAFLPIERIADARRLLARFPDTLWLPDTAHLFLTGEDLDAALALAPGRMPAIHVKDWDAAYGRSYHRYARGFVPLGRGQVPLQSVLHRLRSSGFDGWIVVEQDHSPATGSASVDAMLAESVRYLGGHSQPLTDAAEVQTTFPLGGDRAGAYARLAYQLAHAGTTQLPDAYRTIAQELRAYFEGDHVALWAVRPGSNHLVLLAEDPDTSALRREAGNRVPIQRSLKQEAILQRRAIDFDLADDASTQPRSLQWNEVAKHFGSGHFLAVPVLNRFNHHHVRLLAGVLRADAYGPTLEAEGLALSETIAPFLDESLDNQCAYAVGRIAGLAERNEGLRPFLERLRDVLQDALECEGVTIFLTDRTGERLIPAATTGIAWRDTLGPQQQFYPRTLADSPTVACWQERKILLQLDGPPTPDDGPPHVATSWETAGVEAERDNLLLIPLVSATRDGSGDATTLSVIGVARCRNKRPRAGVPPAAAIRYFSQDDAALADALCGAAVPHIRLLTSDERRRKAVSEMTHELSKPVNGLRAAVDNLRTDLRRIDPDTARHFRQDYIKNILSWTKLMTRVIGNADIYGVRSILPELETEHAYLMADVVAPAVDLIEYFLDKRHFDKRRIRYSAFSEIPRLFIDVNLFQQVFFNLFSNAIKYAYDDPKRFEVEIATAADDSWYYVHCRDWGPGILPEFQNAIFEEGVRGPETINEMVPGQGLGLWIVREVVRRHGGRVTVTQFYRPTQITLALPVSLRSAPPRRGL
jgi:signal transduction histidine kinase/sugar phosphate isomerase/epimerase